MLLSTNRSTFPGVRGFGFEDPFLTAASAIIPDNLKTAFELCERVWTIQGTYRTAMERVLSYFITDLDLGDSQSEIKNWQDFLLNRLKIISATQEMLRDRQCYGNALASIFVPVKKLLRCPKCKSLFSLETVYRGSDFKFQWTKDLRFWASCPICKVGSGYRGEFELTGEQEVAHDSITLVRWNVKDFEILFDLGTGRKQFLWRIPETYKKQIRQGSLIHLEGVSIEVLEAIRNNCKFFKFEDDYIYHMAEPVLCGLQEKMQGWGLPRTLVNFGQVFAVQVLRRQNEAIGLDYVTPIRLITPSQQRTSTGQDYLLTADMGDFTNFLRQVIRRHRFDPTGYQVAPFAVQYQMLGGEAKQLAPVELLEYEEGQLLNNSGVPVELHRGTLQLQTLPVSLRLFESLWQPLVRDANDFLQWVVRRCADIMNWEPIKATWRSVRHLDDIQKQLLLAQFVASGDVSRSTMVEALGYDRSREQRRIMDETREQFENQRQLEEEMAQAGFAEQVAMGMVPGTGPAAMPPGGAMDPAMAQGGAAGAGPPPGGGTPGTMTPDGQMSPMMAELPVTQYLQTRGMAGPQSPEDVWQTAQVLADALLGRPEGIKDSELRKLKQADPVLHGAVRQAMDAKRSEAKKIGGSAVLAQQYGGGGM